MDEVVSHNAESSAAGEHADIAIEIEVWYTPLACLLLAWVDRAPGPVARRLIVFGRVPLFYYVLHLFALEALVAIWAVSRFGWQAATWTITQPPPAAYTEYGLWPAYAAWAVLVVSLYPACAWYARVKARRRSVWLSYL